MSVPDKLTIETPEQIPLEFSLAGVGSRFLALAVDTLVQFIVALVLLVVSLLVSSAQAWVWPKGLTWTAAVVLFALFSLYYGYFAFFESIWNGQTPGKRHCRLRVIKDSGRPITVHDAISRNLLRIIDQLPGVYAVGIVSAVISRQNKRLGDYVAGTVVVHEKPFEEAEPGWEETATDAPLYNAGRLSVEEFQLIEAFLARRFQLDPAVRHQTARQIYERIAPKLEIRPEDNPGLEKVLEAVVRERRRLARYRS
jgi:uncharacterized RDD family membrane protein YckC